MPGLSTETILNGFFSKSFLIQLAMGVGLSFLWRMTAVVPTTSCRRKYRSPCLEMPPSCFLPPVKCCYGVRRAKRQIVYPNGTSALDLLALVGVDGSDAQHVKPHKPAALIARRLSPRGAQFPACAKPHERPRNQTPPCRPYSANLTVPSALQGNQFAGPHLNDSSPLLRHGSRIRFIGKHQFQRPAKCRFGSIRKTTIGLTIEFFEWPS